MNTSTPHSRAAIAQKEPDQPGDAGDNTRGAEAKVAGFKFEGFLAKAKKAGETPEKFAKANLHAKGPLGAMARQYWLKMDLHGDASTNMEQAGDKRTPGQKLYQVG